MKLFPPGKPVGMGPALVASVAFHGVALGWLLCFSPVKVIDPAAPSQRISQGRARQVADQLRERQQQPLSDSLRELGEIRRELLGLEATKRDEFLAFAEKSAVRAATDAAAEQDAVLKAQEQIAGGLEATLAELELFFAKRSNANFDRVSAAHEKSRELHAKILSAQDRALGVLSLGEEKHAAAAAAQRQANDAQAAVGRKLDELDEARDLARGSRQRTPVEREYEHHTYHLVRAQRRLAEAPAELETIARRTRDIEAMAKSLDADFAAAPADRRQKLESQQAVVRQELAGLAKEKESAEKNLARARADLPGLQAKVTALEAELAAAPPPQATAEDGKLAALQKEAASLQRQALALQATARGEVARLPADRVPADLRDRALAALGPLPEAAPAALPDGDLGEIYRQAVETESSITEGYRRFRAMELAMIRRIPLERALGMTDVAKTRRPALGAELAAPASTGEELTVAREALQRARGEMSSMVHGGNSMLSQARGLGGEGGAPVSFDADFDKARQWEMLQALAAEDDNALAKDLSAMMGGEGFGDGANGGPGGEGPGGGPWGVAGGTPGGPPGGMAGSSGFLPGGPGGPPAMGVDVRKTKAVPALAGRRIAARGPSLPWVFVDSWYILGPFDNPRRMNLDTKFPPETVVDLNATYPGKNGVPIRWEFFQSGTPNVMPPFRGYNQARRIDGLDPELAYRHHLQYAIYYAYSELRFEQDCDLWVAIGSDDHSKLWINDQPVWASGKGAKAWHPGEGYRKVHFKAGVNRVLYRVENGNDRTEFSLLIGMEP